jgi:hypothetical protein
MPDCIFVTGKRIGAKKERLEDINFGIKLRDSCV